MQGRLTSRRFVGRSSELAELELAFREAAAGRPSLILLGGESGFGKTRLLAEFERVVDGALVLRGECLEQGDGELPYAPLLTALRPLTRRRDPSLAELSSGSRRYLASLLPSIGDDEAPAASGSELDAIGQVRLFEALLELLDLLCARSPVVLILEDVHWADRSTRTFAAFLARSVRDQPVVVVLSYRSDELHRRHPLRPLLAELERLDRTRRLELRPFDRDELTAALSDILGRTPEADVIDRLLTRTEGNPLYLEELLAAGLDGRGATPQSLRDAFLWRIERLSADARAVVRAVAVGERLREPAIAAAGGIEGERLLDGLREAVAEHVLQPGDDGQLGFRHALLRETVYDDLLPGERGELHIALARWLEREGGAAGADDEVERVATVAAHYAAAGEQAAALRATVAAALVARRVHAWGEVAVAAERALELWPRVPADSHPESLDHVELLALAARAHALAGDRARGEQLMQLALGELDPDREPIRYGAQLARLARMQWHLNRAGAALESAERARVHLAGDGAECERASLLSWIARTQVLRGRYRDAVVGGQAALEAAVAAGDRRTEGEVLNTLGTARIALGDVERGEQQLRQAIALAREEDDLDAVATAHCNLADLLSLAGRTREALQIARDGLAETPQRLPRGHDWLSLTVCVLAFEAGDWALAREHLRPPASQATGTTLIFRQLSEAELALGEGDNDRAAACLESAAPLVRASREAQWHGLFGSLLADRHRRQGDLEAAQAAVTNALDELEVCTDDVMRIARVTAVGLGVEADRAQRARDLRDAAAARDARARARIHLQRLQAAAQAGGPVERAWREVGLAEAARARGRGDARLWSRAAVAWEALERPYLATGARLRQAEAEVESGARADAAGTAGTALEQARALGARWLESELEALIARGRLQRRGAEAVPGADPQAGADQATGAGEPSTDAAPFGLTPRELQVLSLVAAGATNRQIGASLYMAEKTASVHVSRILAKLGVSSRTQAAALAHRRHLT